MKKFMDEDFLLNNDTAKKLYAEAAQEPIFDYHCHLSPKEIYEDKPFEDITQLWLGGDHYKWRAMRNCGVDEKYITGDADRHEKFLAWAGALPLCVGNPVYHWTHLELRRFFGIDRTLSPDSAEEIWNAANAKIHGGDFTPRRLIVNSNVAALCTTDDPADSLAYHRLLAKDESFKVTVLPAFRPDKALNPNAAGFPEYIEKLGAAAGIKISSFDSMKAAMTQRVEYFCSLGCVASDHSFMSVPYRRADEAKVDAAFKKALAGGRLDAQEEEEYRTELMLHLAGEYHRRGIAMELHIGAMRNNNARMFAKLGPDTGFDSIYDGQVAEPLSRLMDAMDSCGELPKTILFAMNPKDNYIMASMTGNFQSSEAPGKIQFGSAWWMNDHIGGMRRQITDLAQLGSLGRFIGMVTDSRSFLSYPRHEYFRRILCGLIGDMVENGEYPADMKTLSEIVRGISYRNAAAYFSK